MYDLKIKVDPSTNDTWSDNSDFDDITIDHSVKMLYVALTVCLIVIVVWMTLRCLVSGLHLKRILCKEDINSEAIIPISFRKTV